MVPTLCALLFPFCPQLVPWPARWTQLAAVTPTELDEKIVADMAKLQKDAEARLKEKKEEMKKKIDNPE